MSTMQLADLVLATRDKSGLTREQTHRAVTSLFEVIKDTLLRGDEIELRGFGTFKTVRKKPRKYADPRTHEIAIRPQTRAPRLNFASNVRKAVREAFEEPVQAEE